MNMLAFSLLLLSVAAAFILVYCPEVYISLKLGIEFAAASKYTFQSCTLAAAGAANQ